MTGRDFGANRSDKTSQNAVPVISKQGKVDLRYALYQAAFVAASRHKDFDIDEKSGGIQHQVSESGIKTKSKNRFFKARSINSVEAI